MRLVDINNSWGKDVLHCWYIDYVDENNKAQWTDEHIEELCNDFYVIPKNCGVVYELKISHEK